MARIEDLTPRRLFPLKCSIDGQVTATKQIIFTYGWTLPLCEQHLIEIEKATQGRRLP